MFFFSMTSLCWVPKQSNLFGYNEKLHKIKEEEQRIMLSKTLSGIMKKFVLLIVIAAILITIIILFNTYFQVELQNWAKRNIF